jgi:hypothetical protein
MHYPDNNHVKELFISVNINEYVVNIAMDSHKKLNNVRKRTLFNKCDMKETQLQFSTDADKDGSAICRQCTRTGITTSTAGEIYFIRKVIYTRFDVQGF